MLEHEFKVSKFPAICEWSRQVVLCVAVVEFDLENLAETCRNSVNVECEISLSEFLFWNAFDKPHWHHTHTLQTIQCIIVASRKLIDN